MIPASITAGDLSNLQQQTNQAYEQMKQAESQLSNARKDVQVKRDNLRYHQERQLKPRRSSRPHSRFYKGLKKISRQPGKNGMRIPRSFIRSGTGKNEVMKPKLPDITATSLYLREYRIYPKGW